MRCTTAGTGDVNFALFFPLWDRLLGTLLYLPGYTLAADDMGIGDRPDYPQAYRVALLCMAAGGYPGKPDYASVTLLRSEAARLVVLRATKASPRAWVRR